MSRRRAVLGLLVLVLVGCGLPRAPEDYALPFRTGRDYLEVFDGERYRPIFVKGMNLGVGVPGTRAGELALQREDYLRWFARMSELGINAVRVYTLHHPRLYEALYEYNSFHPEKPMYLMQGIWLDEENPRGGLDLHDFTADFHGAIEEVVDCIYGQREIPHRLGRAFGRYEVNVSRWVLGWVLGREIFPDEAIETNWRHSEDQSYQGEAVSLASGTATEVWAAAHIDKTIVYERQTYGAQRPVGWSSWPTLDPLHHPTEPHFMSGEDTATLSLADLDLSKAPGGFYASFHAYPYYPNFVSEQPDYQPYEDSWGPNSYLGYLSALKQHYAHVPLLIGEYGVPSSWGNAHYAHSGMHHGGHTERQQGEYDGRMTENIYQAGCGGGMLFAWIDEWWKRTWIVDEISERSRYEWWWDITSPEQNFGLIAFEPDPPDFAAGQLATGSGRLRRLSAAANAVFFHVQVVLAEPLADGETLTLGFDTYRDDLGESVLPGGIITTQRSELALVVSPPATAQLYVTAAYDTFGIWHGYEEDSQLFKSTATDGAPWVKVRWLNDGDHSSDDGTWRFARTIDPVGSFGLHLPGTERTSKDAVSLSADRKTIEVRLPWTLLNVRDPSRLQVIHYDRPTRGREGVSTAGFGLLAAIGEEQLRGPRFLWPGWETTPRYREREKPAMAIYAEFLKTLPEYP